MIIDSVKRSLNSQEKIGSAIMTLIISLVIVTPLCGLVFQCGCDWPWLGLDEKCNYYQENSNRQCPWCISMITGVISVGTAIIAGVWASIISVNLLINQQAVVEILIRVLLGVTMFILVAIITAGLAAIL